jgi:hypothetical protein
MSVNKFRNPAGALYTTNTTTYVKALEYVSGGVHRTVLKFTAFAVTVTLSGTGTTGGAGVKVYTFPKGVIQIIASCQRWTKLLVDGTDLANNAVLDIGLGSVTATSAMSTLATTTQNLVGKKDVTMSTATSALNVTQVDTIEPAGASGLDGSSTAIAAYLNVAAASGIATADGTLTLTGEMEFYWRNFGYAAE